MITQIFLTDLTKVQETIDDFALCGLQCEVIYHSDCVEIDVYLEE